MRILSSLSAAVLLASVACFALGCGGVAERAPSDGTRDPQPAATGTTPPVTAKPGETKPGDGPACPTPAPVLVANGGTIVRPAGSALRLQLVYQGSSIGVSNVRGVDMILGPSGGPFAAGKGSGYWFETRSASGVVYQHLFQDPTRQEAPGDPSTSGGFSNSTLDRCVAKTILADVPNNASTTELIVYGSPYGTSDAAIELARFSLK